MQFEKSGDAVLNVCLECLLQQHKMAKRIGEIHLNLKLHNPSQIMGKWIQCLNSLYSITPVLICTGMHTNHETMCKPHL